jgi:hypothetical protein
VNWIHKVYIDTGSGSCEHYNEVSGVTEGGEFLNQMSDNEIFMRTRLYLDVYARLLRNTGARGLINSF